MRLAITQEQIKDIKDHKTNEGVVALATVIKTALEEQRDVLEDKEGIPHEELWECRGRVQALKELDQALINLLARK